MLAVLAAAIVDDASQQNAIALGSTMRIMTKIATCLLGLFTIACITPGKGSQTPVFACDTDGGGHAGSIASWARERATATDSSGPAFRKEYGISGSSQRDWYQQIRTVSDNDACRRAGIAYAESSVIRPGLHRVAVVAIGQRYVAIDTNAIKTEGEFMLEAILDRQFRVVIFMLN